MKHTKITAQIGIASAILLLVAILSLHFLSPEIDPTWHMISEYAYGQYGWILSFFFFAWAVSYWATGIALIPFSKTLLSKICVFLLFVSGVGALMGGLFDVRHSLHGAAFGLGIPFLPIIAPLMTRYLRRKYTLANTYTFITAQATWVSFIVMAVSMAIFMSQMQKAGALDMTTPKYIATLPESVTPIIGIMNRFLVGSYIAWLLAVNYLILKSKKLIK